MSDHIVSFWTQFRRDKKAIWITTKAQTAVRRKQKAWRKYQKQKTTKNLEHYKKCQKDAKQEIGQAKRDFERKLA